VSSSHPIYRCAVVADGMRSLDGAVAGLRKQAAFVDEMIDKPHLGLARAVGAPSRLTRAAPYSRVAARTRLYRCRGTTPLPQSR
jgi:hypothetical protein